MTSYYSSSLRKFFQTYQAQIPELVDYETQLEKILQQEKSPQPVGSLQREESPQQEESLQPIESPQQEKSLIALYDQIYPLVEKLLWECDDFDEMLAIYQSLFREQEALINRSGTNERYDFVLSIPIADRPEHLRGCLESIFQLCSLYSYGGKTRVFFQKSP